MEQKPSIGRIVHYQRHGSPNGDHKSEPSPAVITHVHTTETGAITMEVALFVMNPTGTYFQTITPYSAEPKPGHWSWLPRI